MKKLKFLNLNGNRKPKADLVLYLRKVFDGKDHLTWTREALKKLFTHRVNLNSFHHYLKDSADAPRLEEIIKTFSRKQSTHTVKFLFDTYSRKDHSVKVSIYVVRKSDLMSDVEIREEVNKLNLQELFGKLITSGSLSDLIWFKENCQFEEEKVFSNAPAYFYNEKLAFIFKVYNKKQIEEMKIAEDLVQISEFELKKYAVPVTLLSSVEYDLKNNEKTQFKFVSSKTEKIMVKEKLLNQDSFLHELGLSEKKKTASQLLYLDYGQYSAYVEPLKRSMLLIVTDNVVFGEKTKVCYLQDYGVSKFKIVV